MKEHQETAPIEYIICYDDGTWELAIHAVPRAWKPELWAAQELISRDEYRDVVHIGVFNAEPEFFDPEDPRLENPKP